MARRGDSTRIVEGKRVSEEVRHLDAESVDADELSGTVRFLFPEDTESDWQTAIDEVEAAGGGHVVPTPGTYVTEGLALGSNVTLDPLVPLGAAFKLADGATSPIVPVLKTKENATNVTIRNVEVDGNESNNRAEFSNPNRGHGIAIAGDTSGQAQPEDCLVEKCYVHDTVRTNVSVSANESVFRDLTCRNAATDHWFYLAHGSNNLVENIEGTGFCKTGGIIVGGNPTDAIGNTIRHVRAHDTALTPESYEPKNIIEVRENTNATIKGTRIEDVRVWNPNSEGLALLIQRPTVLDGFDYEGPSDKIHMVTVASGAGGSTLTNMDIEVTATTTSTTNYGVRVLSSDVTVSDSILIESTGSGVYRGVLLDDDAGQIENICLKNLKLKMGNFAGFRLSASSGISNVAIDNCTIGGGHGQVVDSSGPVTYQSGTMFPQDVRNATPWYEGREGYHDGSGTDNTVGPAIRTSSSWVSLVDGTTIS